MSAVIWCSNFSMKTTEEELADLFAAKGFKPVEVLIIRYRKTEPLLRPHSFLKFDGDLTASDVVAEMNGELYGVRRLLVRAAKPQGGQPTA